MFPLQISVKAKILHSEEMFSSKISHVPPALALLGEWQCCYIYVHDTEKVQLNKSPTDSLRSEQPPYGCLLVAMGERERGS